jgi:hypothetical protein
MNYIIDELVTKIRDNFEDCDDSGDVVTSYFNDEVECVFKWKAEDYQGLAFAIYKFKGKLFFLHGYFGSCDVCDDYMAEREIYVEKVRNYLKQCTFFDHLYEVTFPFESQYMDRGLLTEWKKFLDECGEDNAFEKCIQLSNLKAEAMASTL